MQAYKTATLWKWGRKWNGEMGWVFAGCGPVRREADWSDYFRGLMSSLRDTFQPPKVRVSKHHNKAPVKRNYSRRSSR